MRRAGSNTEAVFSPAGRSRGRPAPALHSPSRWTKDGCLPKSSCLAVAGPVLSLSKERRLRLAPNFMLGVNGPLAKTEARQSPFPNLLILSTIAQTCNPPDEWIRVFCRLPGCLPASCHNGVGTHLPAFVGQKPGHLLFAELVADFS